MKQLTKRQRAVEQLMLAQGAITKAISLFGGYTRSRVPKTQSKAIWVARKMVESIEPRITAAIELCLTQTLALETSSTIIALRDDFEREYDRERRPQC